MRVSDFANVSEIRINVKLIEKEVDNVECAACILRTAISEHPVSSRSFAREHAFLELIDTAHQTR